MKTAPYTRSALHKQTITDDTDFDELTGNLKLMLTSVENN